MPNSSRLLAQWRVFSPVVAPLSAAGFILWLLATSLGWLLRTGYIDLVLQPGDVLEVVQAPADSPILVGDTLLAVDRIYPESAGLEDAIRFVNDLTHRYQAGDRTEWLVRRGGEELEIDVVLGSFPLSAVLSHLILYGLLWLLAGLMLWRRPASREIHLLIYTVLCFSAGQLLRLVTLDRSTPFGFLAGQVEALTQYLAPALLVHFSSQFPVATLRERTRRRVLIAAYAIPFPLYLIKVWLQLRASDPARRYVFAPQWLVDLHFFDVTYWVLIASLFSSAALLIHTHRRLTSNRERAQIRWLIWSVATAAALDGLIVVIRLYLEQLDMSTAFTANRMLIYMLIPFGLGVATLKPDLLDVDRVMRSTLLFGVLTAFLVVIFGVVQLGSASVLNWVAQQGIWSGWIAAVATAAVMPPLYDRLRASTDLFLLERLPPTGLSAGPAVDCTVVFADLVGYTELTFQDEGRALDLLNEFHWTARRVARRVGGRLVKTVGDAALFEFSDTDRALTCVDELLRELSARVSEQGFGVNGLHCGAHRGLLVRDRDGDIFGDVVIVAQRLQSASAAGELLMTEQVAAAASSARRSELVDAGPILLKSLPRPLRCYRYHLRAQGEATAFAES